MTPFPLTLQPPLLPLAQHATESVRRTLVLLSEWPEPVRWVVLALGIVILAMTVWNVRKARPRWHRALLVGLRVGLLLLLGMLFLEPTIQEERVTRNRNHVLVLADASRSMALPHGDTSRAALVRAFLGGREAFWDTLRSTSDLAFFRFAAGLEPIDAGELPQAVTADGPRTDLQAALEALRERYRDRDVAGVLVLSDGCDNGPLSARLAGAAGLDPETRRLVEAFDAPFFTYGIAGTPDLKDVAVESLRAAEFAFLLNRATIEATVRVTGYREGTLRVSLLEDGAVVAHRTIELLGAPERSDVSFDVVPKELGEHVYTVTAEPLAGEVTRQNNARSAVVRVLRDRIRVLQIAGHPSWDVRFLRNLLKQNPNVDLISFFILVNTTNLLAVSPTETSLIPFPARELFVEELGGFDLVILQDFNYGPFSTRQHLHRVSQFVRDGGALLMVGGRLAFSAGGYHQTAITEVLPVTLPPGGLADTTLSTAHYRPRVTPAGEFHPILQVGADAAETRSLWDRLPPLEGANLFDGLEPGGLALAEHPVLRHGGERRPVIAVREVGQGRSMVFGTDASWFWSFRQAGLGQDPRVYDRFWNNAIRWLIKDPTLDLVQVRASAERFRLRETIQAEITVRQPDYRPAADSPLSVKVWRRATVPGDIERLVHEQTDVRTDAEGAFHLTWQPDQPGIYEIVAESTQGALKRAGRDLLTVEDVDPELAEVVPTVPVLQLLAQATGGYFAPLDGPAIPPPVEEPKTTEVTQREFHDLWTSPWLLALAILFFATEWSLRRRWGYL
jgi:uncharacterized membrane protein